VAGLKNGVLLNGILNVFKPAGITSFGVIRQVRKISGEKKIGHIGTLDPLAEGVLPLFLGKMTKLISLFNSEDKKYRVSARFGAFSTTMDGEGVVTAVPIPADCSNLSVTRALTGFIGEHEQTPPMFSAVKVKGKKLYQYARKGESVEREPRKIIIHSIRDIRCELPQLNFEVHCSKGTFVRALVEDLGRQCGTGAYMTGLIRIACGPYFTTRNAINLEEIRELNKIDLQNRFIEPESLLVDWHIVSAQTPEAVRHLRQGRAIPVTSDNLSLSSKDRQNSKAMAKDPEGRIIAIGRLEFSQDGHGSFRPLSVLV